MRDIPPKVDGPLFKSFTKAARKHQLPPPQKPPDPRPPMCGGVLVYMVAPNGATYVVLGREQYVRGWKSSLTWCDFSGQRDNDLDRDEIATASREFFEESIGIFGDMEPRLRSNQFSHHITMRRNDQSVARSMYAVQVPWTADVARRFYGRREHLRQILFVVAETRKLQCELNKLQAPVPDFIHTIHRADGDVDAGEGVNYCSEGRRVLIIGIDRLFESEDGATHIGLKYVCASRHRTNHEPIRNISVQIDPNQIPIYRQLMALHDRFSSLYMSFPSEVTERAMVWRQYDQGVKSWIPYVRHEFLEKDRLRLWSILELNDEATHHWRSDTPSQIRHSFMPVLKLLLNELAYNPEVSRVDPVIKTVTGSDVELTE